MKTQISYTKLDGGNGLALVDGTVESPLSAKRRLAAALKLPGDIDGDGDNDAVDERLRLGGVDPLSVQTAPASE